MAKIGFIGLGKMGLPMVENLLAAGHEVKAFDLFPQNVAAAEEAGAAAADSIADAAKGVDAVISMVPEGKHVRAVYEGDEGVFANADPETLLIDSSTIDVATSRVVSRQAVEAGFDMVDAPVSGGVGGAVAATLTFMVGGSEKAFERASPFLEIMGGKIIHTGGPGNGQAAKICNNMLLAISMIGTSEAFALGRRLGLDDQTLFDVSSVSSGANWSLTTYCPVPGPVPTSPANNDYKAGFAADMMLKDLRLAQAAAADSDIETPLGELSEALYSRLAEKGGGGLDFSAVFKMLDGSL
ncbi:MAG: 3-hydroxyisobutyrate dehydrogenase [Proteobacteria bacterium]|nr:3-hydroxyisobutyrate dehydrogenase [Pseudomonadota bacterium]